MQRANAASSLSRLWRLAARVKVDSESNSDSDENADIVFADQGTTARRRHEFAQKENVAFEENERTTRSEKSANPRVWVARNKHTIAVKQ